MKNLLVFGLVGVLTLVASDAAMALGGGGGKDVKAKRSKAQFKIYNNDDKVVANEGNGAAQFAATTPISIVVYFFGSEDTEPTTPAELKAATSLTVAPGEDKRSPRLKKDTYTVVTADAASLEMLDEADPDDTIDFKAFVIASETYKLDGKDIQLNVNHGGISVRGEIEEELPLDR